MAISWVREPKRGLVGGRKGSREVVALFRSGKRREREIYFISFWMGKGARPSPGHWFLLSCIHPNTWQEEDGGRKHFLLLAEEKKNDVEDRPCESAPKKFFQKIKKKKSFSHSLTGWFIDGDFRFESRYARVPLSLSTFFFFFPPSFGIHPSPSIDCDVTFNYAKATERERFPINIFV